MQIVRQKYSPLTGIKAPEADQFEMDYLITPIWACGEKICEIFFPHESGIMTKIDQRFIDKQAKCASNERVGVQMLCTVRWLIRLHLKTTKKRSSWSRMTQLCRISWLHPWSKTITTS